MARDEELRRRYTLFNANQSIEDQEMLAAILHEARDSAKEYAMRKIRVDVLRSLGLNGRGECRHCPGVSHCEHGGLTSGQ